MMEDDSFDYESEAVYVSTHVQDLISSLKPTSASRTASSNSACLLQLTLCLPG